MSDSELAKLEEQRKVDLESIAARFDQLDRAWEEFMRDIRYNWNEIDREIADLRAEFYREIAAVKQGK